MLPEWVPPRPRLLRYDGQRAVFRWGEGEQACQPDEDLGPWRCRAFTTFGGQRLVVLECTLPDQTALAYLRPYGERACLWWPVGELHSLAQDPLPPTFPPGYFDEVRSHPRDVLGERILAAGDDPEPAGVSDALPPLVSYTFIGDRRIADKPIVEPNGSVRGYFDAGREWDPRDAQTAWRHGLVDACLPAVCFAYYDRVSGAGREQIAFGRPAEGGGLEVWVRLREDGAGPPGYFRSTGVPVAAEPAGFYAALLALREEQDSLLQRMAKTDLPDPRVQDGLRAALLRGLLTFVGLHPKYGVGTYQRPEHDTFPPAVLFLAASALEWGLFEEGKALLGHYLTSFVRSDGTVAYYGPAVSEYGQLLALSLRCLQLTRDRRWFAGHRRYLLQIGRRLCGLRAKSRLATPPGSPTHGLIPGLPEADYAAMGLREDAYYSGDAWAWRGLRSLAEALALDDDTEEASRYMVEAQDYARDIRASLDQCSRLDLDPPFVPVIAGQHTPPGTLTESTAASYANYRFYPELLSAGLLTDEQRDAVLRFRWTHGGDLLATTRFQDRLDDWPVPHYAWGLISADQVGRVRLLLLAHLLHHQSRGTFTAYEQVPFDPGDLPVRRHVADYCVCAQLVVPLVLKWMLAWEPWDEEVLWLCRATPRAWHAPGKRFGVRELPTRWGPVGLQVEGQAGIVDVRLWLPTSIPEVRLRLHPSGLLTAVRVNGVSWKAWEAERGTVTLRESGGAIRVVGEYRAQG